MKNKKDRYMGDVGIIRKIDDIPELKDELITAFDSKSHFPEFLCKPGSVPSFV